MPERTKLAKKDAYADDDCFTLASEDINENKHVAQRVSTRAVSPSPGSLSQLSRVALTS